GVPITDMFATEENADELLDQTELAVRAREFRRLTAEMQDAENSARAAERLVTAVTAKHFSIRQRVEDLAAQLAQAEEALRMVSRG
ncbi:MAG: hypothetical protein ACR2K2_14905, partial [Mycobacteriales bacterium]